MSSLSLNQVILWEMQDEKKEFERILWISPNMEYMYVINLKLEEFPFYRNVEEITTAIKNGDARIVKFLTEPEQMVGISLKRKEEIEKSWQVIQEIVLEEPEIFQKEYRGMRVRDMQAKWNLSRPTVVKYLKRYWQAGKIKNGLLNRYDLCGDFGSEKLANDLTKKRGRPRKITKIHPEKIGINVTTDVLQAILYAKTKYVEQEKLNHRQAYHKMILKFFVDEYKIENGKEIPVPPDKSKIPEFKTFMYWITKEKRKDPVTFLTNRYGERKYNLNMREKTGNSTKTATGPGSRFQIDATIADVNLISSYDSKLVIGKPVIYTVLDVFSHAYTGLYIGLEGPSYLGAMMAIQNTGSSKVEFCKRYDIDITEEDWPCHHMPQQFTADRGEMLTQQNYGLRNAIGVDLEYAPPYRADLKPLVESNFNVLNHGVIHRLPGNQALMRKRGEKDNRLDSVLTIMDFTQLIIWLILKHNKTKWMKGYPLDADQVADDIKPVPNELWNWGKRNRGSSLRTIDEDVLKVNLLPSDKARITNRGIVYKGVPYTCERARKEGWFLKLHNAKMGKEVEIAYDPRCTDKIFLKLKGGLLFEDCSLVHPDHLANNKTWDEFEQIMEVIDLGYEEHNQQEVDEEVKYSYLIEKTIELAKENKEESNLSVNKQLKGIRKNRSEEKAARRVDEHAFNSLNNNEDTPKNEISEIEINLMPETFDQEQEVPNTFSRSKAKKNQNENAPFNSRIASLQQAQLERRAKKGRR